MIWFIEAYKHAFTCECVHVKCSTSYAYGTQQSHGGIIADWLGCFIYECTRKCCIRVNEAWWLMITINLSLGFGASLTFKHKQALTNVMAVGYGNPLPYVTQYWSHVEWLFCSEGSCGTLSISLKLHMDSSFYFLSGWPTQTLDWTG